LLNQVLILSASAGAGHVRAGQALELALREREIARTVRHVDALELTNKVFRRLYSKLYLEMVDAAPKLLGCLYDYLDTPWEKERRRLFVDKLNTRKLMKLLTDTQPDAVLCTHFLPAEIISWMRAKERFDRAQGIVVTDFDVHAMWLCHHYEAYFVALEETRVHLEQLAIPPEKIFVTGIPIDPVFAEARDPAQARNELGLAPEMTTLLLSAGGFGVGPIEKLVSALLLAKHPLQIVAICGRNALAKQRLESLLARSEVGPHRVHVEGYTTQMDLYMSASDLLVGKPGGLTTSEALAKGLVMVIVNPIPGQEERNSDHLLEQGAAIRCNNLPTLGYKLDALLADAQRFERMRANVRKLARPDAARTIAEHLPGLVSRQKCVP